MNKRILLSSLILVFLGLLLISCQSSNATTGNAANNKRANAYISGIIIENRKVNVYIKSNVSLAQLTVNIDGNELSLPNQIDITNATDNIYLASASLSNTPNIFKWLNDKMTKAKENYDKVQYDYSVWCYDQLKDGNYLNPRITEKDKEYKQKLTSLNNQLQQYQAIWNRGISSGNVISELNKYAKIVNYTKGVK